MDDFADERAELRPVIGPDEFGSVYVYMVPWIMDGDVAKVVKHGPNCVLDYGHDGKLLGIEILDVAPEQNVR